MHRKERVQQGQQGINFSLCANKRREELQGLKQGSHNNDENYATRKTYQSTRLWKDEIQRGVRHSRQRKHIKHENRGNTFFS
eukprot:5731295-Heterocapsa_arctica.AAC.1